MKLLLLQPFRFNPPQCFSYPIFSFINAVIVNYHLFSQRNHIAQTNPELTHITFIEILSIRLIVASASVREASEPCFWRSMNSRKTEFGKMCFESFYFVVRLLKPSIRILRFFCDSIFGMHFCSNNCYATVCSQLKHNFAHILRR